MSSLVVEALSVGPEGRALLKGLSFTLAPSERLALVGPSGIGKTAALRALALLDDPLAGAMTLGGDGPEALGVPTWRRRVLLVSQRASFFGGAVHDELARPFGYASADRAFEEDAARDALDRLGLAAKWDAPTATLSEGEAQRVALVRALLLRPDVLLLDEPTSALDPDATARAEALIADRGAAVALVTHDAEQRRRLDARPLELTELAVA